MKKLILVIAVFMLNLSLNSCGKKTTCQSDLEKQKKKTEASIDFINTLIEHELNLSDDIIIISKYKFVLSERDKVKLAEILKKLAESKQNMIVARNKLQQTGVKVE